MRIFLTLLRRELGSLFLSVTGYVIIAAVTFIVGLTFVLLIAPLITMRLFAHEKFTGTFETLMTTPVSDLQVVTAKFSAAIVFYMIMWLPLLGGLLIVRHFANETSAMDAGAIGGLYVGLLLLGGFFLSIGCFASSLTRSQMVAAILSLAFGISFIFVSYLSGQVTLSGWEAQVLASFNLTDQVRDFTRGVVDTRPVIFYASLSLLFLFLTLRVVESRRWK